MTGRRLEIDLVPAPAEGHDSGDEEDPHARHALRLAAPAASRQLAGPRCRQYRPLMRSLIFAAVVLALTSCHQNAPQRSNNETAAASAGVWIKGLHRDNEGKAAPVATFSDSDGRPAKLTDFKGKPVLLNLWATWCAPCVKELPTLDKLAQSGTISVVAISQDTGPNASVVAFLKEHHIARLKPYQDPKMALSGALGPDTVLPTSILIGADGKEVWRYVGDLDWTSAEASKLLAEAGAVPTKG